MNPISKDKFSLLTRAPRMLCRLILIMCLIGRNGASNCKGTAWTMRMQFHIVLAN